MPILNFDEPSRSSRKGVTPITVNKPLKLILGIGALAGVIALGSTLAANIGINTGAPIEFGQGVAQTTACSGTTPITVLPTSSFVNAPGAAGDFYFTSLTISNIPNSCVGRQFSISAFGKSGNPLKLTKCSDIGTTPVIKFMGNSETSYTADSLADMYTRVTNKTSTSFTVDWDSGSECGGSATTLAKNVYNITIESSKDSGTYISTTASVNVDATSTADISGSYWVNNGTTGDDLSFYGNPPQTNSGSEDGGGNLEFNGNPEIPQYATGNYAVDSKPLHRVTVELWMKLESETGNDWPMLFVTGTDSQYDIARVDNEVGFNTWNDDIYGFDASSYMGSWHHYVFVLSDGDRNTQKIYVDGVLQSLTANGFLGDHAGAEHSANRNFPITGFFSAFSNSGWLQAHAFVGGMRIYPGELPLASIQANFTSYHSRLP